MGEVVGGVEAVVEIGGVGVSSVGVVGEVGSLSEAGEAVVCEDGLVGVGGVSSAKPTQERGRGWYGAWGRRT